MANQGREMPILEIQLTNEELNSRVPDPRTIRTAWEALNRDGPLFLVFSDSRGRRFHKRCISVF